MKNYLSVLVLVACLITSFHYVGADAVDDSIQTLVPEIEKEIAQTLKAEGPTETVGIESSIILGLISLDGEFEGTDGYMLRVREVTIRPGGQVAVHQHNSRPGVAYMLEGELIEHRNDSQAPITRRAGDVALEKTGTIHWWKNESNALAKAVVVDIVPAKSE